MNHHRTFDEHVQLFVAFAARVAALSPAAWDRLRLRCVDLDDSAFRALIARADLAARPYRLWLPPGVRRRVGARLIAGLSRVVQMSIAIGCEVVAEFEVAHAPETGIPSLTRSKGNQSTAACVEAHVLIESTLAPFTQTNPGLITAVRTAGQAVLRHDWLERAAFDAAYGLVEAEIPFADLA